MITSIFILAKNTLKENIRDRILLTLLVFSVLLLGSTIFLGSISLDQDAKIITDLGLFGIFFFGVIITLFVGANTIFKELDGRAAYTIFARPLKRWWFLLGKFFGLSATLGILVLCMSVVFLTVMGFRLGWSAIDASLLLALFYIYLELCVLVSLMLMFSTIASSVMSAIYGLAVFLIGHSTTAIVSLIDSSTAQVRTLFRAIYYIFPNLEKFNLRNDAVYHLHPHAPEVLLTILYALLYCVIFLYLASLALRKQDL